MALDDAINTWDDLARALRQLRRREALRVLPDRPWLAALLHRLPRDVFRA